MNSQTLTASPMDPTSEVGGSTDPSDLSFRAPRGGKWSFLVLDGCGEVGPGLWIRGSVDLLGFGRRIPSKNLEGDEFEDEFVEICWIFLF